MLPGGNEVCTTAGPVGAVVAVGGSRTAAGGGCDWVASWAAGWTAGWRVSEACGWEIVDVIES